MSGPWARPRRHGAFAAATADFVRCVPALDPRERSLFRVSRSTDGQCFTVGGNSVSAFLSWRLQATNACDVTLVWKSGFESVSQYGISFKSKLFGNERFKPLHGKDLLPEQFNSMARHGVLVVGR